MKTKVQAALVAAFAADALALPVHWIYDTGKLAKEFGRLDQFLKPAEGSYHCCTIGALKAKSHTPRRQRVTCSLQLIALSFGCSIAQSTYGSG